MKKERKKKIIVPETVSRHIEEEFRKDPEFRVAYMDEIVKLEIARKVRWLRHKRNLSQNQLAKRMGTTQQTVSRLEDPRNTEITITTLAKVAMALRADLQINFQLQTK